MNSAGTASAGLIEQATKEAVDKAVTDALASVSQAASDSLASAVAPALKVIKGAAGSALEAEKSLRDSVGWVGWKWAGICGAASAGLLVVVWSLAVFMTPSGSEMAELRANATDLERRGGKIKLSTCEKRLCARIDAKASGVVYGENGEKWMILDGY